MHDWQSLSHVRWDCKYHIVIVPKYRKKRLYGKFRRRVGDIIRDLLKEKKTKGLHFWSRGYCVSTVGLDEQTIRKYIRDQEKNDKQKGFDFE